MSNGVIEKSLLKIRATAHKMDQLSGAFSLTGNETVAELLFDWLSTLRMAAREIDDELKNIPLTNGSN